MIFTVRTVNFRGHGQIDCRYCNHGTVFPDNAQVISYQWLGQQEIISAQHLGTLHRCGSLYYWWCDHCDEQRPPPTARRVYGSRHRGWQGANACPVCGETIRQRLGSLSSSS